MPCPRLVGPRRDPDRAQPRRLAASTALQLATDRSDAIEAADRIEAIDPADPMEPTDAMEPIEPIERADPTEPIESTDPLQPTHRTESSDHTAHRLCDDALTASIVRRKC